MTMTDPIADMLTRLRNANQAYHDAVTMPYSKLKQGVAEILKQEGYITSFDVAEPAEGEVGKTLTITLKYGRNRERSIEGVRRITVQLALLGVVVNRGRFGASKLPPHIMQERCNHRCIIGPRLVCLRCCLGKAAGLFRSQRA